MKIQCIDSEGCKGLTKGKIYDTDKLICMTYSIINDLGHKENYFSSHFKIINEVNINCVDCNYMRIVQIEDGCGASAKCFKTSKRGKSITWAMTSISFNNEKEEGRDRVIKVLNTKKNSPFWCPIKK